MEGTALWFNYFNENKDFFSSLFSSKSTVSFRKQLLDFMMNQLSKKITNISADKAPEILLRFLSVVVLGILEYFILNELNSSTEEIAKQIGELLLQNILLSSH
ncbi:TetR-like C-terminal domain-containing protein [Clostridium baratii]|uniref:TetR-like C-terminal domain-containing protein n=1 Tax=Clostridium baratii TaxID=1561 RepID=UPI001A9A50CB|nr:TetR-like C-terminal domain-containing protein [Clostridium baratii]